MGVRKEGMKMNLQRFRKFWVRKFLIFVISLCGIGFCQGILFGQERQRGEILRRLFNRLNGGQSRGETTPGKISSLGKTRQKAIGEDLQIAGLRVSVWRPINSENIRSPLVIFSHGFHGSSNQSTFLMSALASDGYLVFSPNHGDALGSGERGGLLARPEEGFGKVERWNDKVYADRANDILKLVAALKKDDHWSAVINWDKIALAGHSLGGYTVLGLAGGWQTWKLPGVKAILALSPYVNPFLKNQSLGDLGVPIMYQGGTADIGVTPFIKKAGGAFDQTSGPAYFIEFNKAGHFVWTDLKTDFQKSINLYSLAFFSKYLKGEVSQALTEKLADVHDLRFK